LSPAGASLQTPGSFEERGEPAVWQVTRAAFSFGLFSLGEQNERPKRGACTSVGPREGNPSSHRDADGG
jgi:hypothetical protein